MGSVEEVRRYAEETLGEVPKVIDLLFRIEESAAVEQFNENVNLYLGRKALPRKVAALIAMSVALASGPKESAAIHFKLARRFGADDLEVLDAIRAAKMAIMSSTLDVLDVMLSNEYVAKEVEGSEESSRFINELLNSVGSVPERIIELAKVSPELAKEHIRERDVLLINSLRLSRKYMFAVALAVSISLRDRECVRTYLNMFIKYGGNFDEVLDVLAIVRFITGNRAFVNAIDLLQELASPRRS